MCGPSWGRWVPGHTLGLCPHQMPVAAPLPISRHHLVSWEGSHTPLGDYS